MLLYLVNARLRLKIAHSANFNISNVKTLLRPFLSLIALFLNYCYLCTRYLYSLTFKNLFVMAKGNLFLGTASRSVGDVTLMRRNGAQVARARVRKISNPRTEGQARQRMLMAAITRFYSPLAACLEKSFEGKNKADSYSAYLKVNTQLGAKLGFAVPKNGSFCPVPVKVSNGTMPAAILAYDSTADAGFLLKAAFTANESVTIASLSRAIMQTYGLEEGDQVTFIYSLAAEDGSYSVEYRRLFLDTTDTSALSIRDLDFTAKAGELKIDHPDDRIAGMAVIFSHYNNGSWRRSTQYFVLAAGTDTEYVGPAAVLKYLPEWMDSATVPSSDVYLNGSVARGSSVTVTINGITYTFVGEGIDTIGSNQYVYFLGSDGKKYYFKLNNEKSDQFGKFYDVTLRTLQDASDGWGVDVAPTDVPDAQIILYDNHTVSFAAAAALERFAFESGWAFTGAAVAFEHWD